ncbi:MAG: argininosuccinate lyase [Thermoplasmata archaeon]|nr:argininosuccinate lyase [Thermoplasmata archaeon]
MTTPTPAPVYVRTPAHGFLNSLSVDRVLARYDLAGSIAHAEMLGHVGILSASEVETLRGGLRRIARELAQGSFDWREDLEDVHTNMEVRLTELVGSVGGKIHSARSRNDQVALDERLFLRAAIHSVAQRTHELASKLLERARQEIETPMAGYTHLQRAQPVTLAHHLLAHFWRLQRDVDRLLATAARSNVSPLGAGALAGSTLPIEPDRVARRLGFDHPFENSLDAVSDRDAFVELAFDLALLSVHLSSMGEELVLWASTEFGYLRASPGLGSGSSLMPQKRNPDVAELVRGKAGRTIGDLLALLVTLKGLPLAYNRDLQEDKAPVLDALSTTEATLAALNSIVPDLQFERERMRETATDPALRATDAAEHLVRHGVPFREAHDRVAAHIAAHGGRFDRPEGGAGLEPGLSAAAWTFDPSDPLADRLSPGGPAPVAVRRQIELADARMRIAQSSLSSLGRLTGLIEELLQEEPK